MRQVLVRLARTVARLVAVTAPLALVPVAAALIFVDPWPEKIERDAIVGVAGIVATVLSLGLTVTLLVAQHTA